MTFKSFCKWYQVYIQSRELHGTGPSKGVVDKMNCKRAASLACWLAMLLVARAEMSAFSPGLPFPGSESPPSTLPFCTLPPSERPPGS